MVAVGDLDKVWMEVPEDVSAEEFKHVFRSYFGVEWTEVLDATNKSYYYNAANNAYFAVSKLRLVENLTLDQLLEKEDVVQPPNIIIS